MGAALLDFPTRAAAFNAALEGLTRLNVNLLERGGFPPLYSAGVRYQTEPREMWRHVGHVFREGWGDCEDLAAWRAAELRLSGEDPGASVATYRSGPRRYHAVVRRADGTIEDPSRVLGMKTAAEKRAEKIMANYRDIVAECPGLCSSVLGEDDDGDEPQEDIVTDPDPENQAITTDAQENKSKGGWRAVARVPLSKGRALMTASSRAATKADATKRALNLATSALDSPYAKTLIPPQAQTALRVLRSPTARKIGRGLRRLRKVW